MPENPLPPNPEGLVADPRYRNLLIHVSYLRLGQQPGSAEVTCEVADGEGEVWFEPGYLPTMGTVQNGTLVIASPCFPRYAPLTLTLRGTDLCFTVRHRQVIGCCLLDGLEELVQIKCANFWRAAHRLRLKRRESDLGDDGNIRHLILEAENLVQPRTTTLETQVLEGTVTSLSCAEIDPDGTSVHDRVFLRRSSDGDLRWRLQAAKLEWDFRDGALTELRLFAGTGFVSRIGFVNLVDARVSVDVAFLDTLP